jgi:hypothetical protein
MITAGRAEEERWVIMIAACSAGEERLAIMIAEGKAGEEIRNNDDCREYRGESGNSSRQSRNKSGYNKSYDGYKENTALERWAIVFVDRCRQSGMERI